MAPTVRTTNTVYRRVPFWRPRTHGRGLEPGITRQSRRSPHGEGANRGRRLTCRMRCANRNATATTSTLRTLMTHLPCGRLLPASRGRPWDRPVRRQAGRRWYRRPMILDPGRGLFHPLLLQAAVMLASLVLSRQQSRFLEDAHVRGGRRRGDLERPGELRDRGLAGGQAREDAAADGVGQGACIRLGEPSLLAAWGMMRSRAVSGCSLNPTGRQAMPDMT